MEIIVNALVIKSVDYKDNDKILTLFSIERGKITAGIKGVKKSGAKLKFASEPFAFCEFVLAEKQGRFTVIGADYVDSFYNLRLDLLKYYASSIVLETLNLLASENEPSPELFSLALSAIKSINYQGGELKVLAGYLLKLIEISGYGLQSLACAGCGEKIDGRVFFLPKFAEFYDFSCKIDGAMEITSETYNALLKVTGKSLTEISGVELSKQSELKLLKFLIFYFQSKTEFTIKSASSLVDFLS